MAHHHRQLYPTHPTPDTPAGHSSSFRPSRFTPTTPSPSFFFFSFCKTMAHRNPSATQKPSNSMDLPPNNHPKSAASSYNPAAHFSKMAIARKTLRARSPPPSTAPTDFPPNSQAPKNPLSKSAILGRSKSLCDSQLKLSNFLVINGVKVFNSDMPPLMQIHAVGSARKTCDSLEKFSSKALAFSLKKEFDGAYGPAWHCIVGTSFGSFVTHSVGGFLYFSMDQKLHILLFKTTVQRAG